MPAFFIRPIDTYIAETLIHRGRLTREQFEGLQADFSESAPDAVTLTDYLIVQGYLDFAERTDLEGRYAQMQRALESSSSVSERPPQPTGAAPRARPLTEEELRQHFDKTVNRHVRPDLASTIHVSPDDFVAEDMDLDIEESNAQMARDFAATVASTPEELGIPVVSPEEAGAALSGPRKVSEIRPEPPPGLFEKSGRVGRPASVELERTFDADTVNEERPSTELPLRPPVLDLERTFSNESGMPVPAPALPKRPGSLELERTALAPDEGLPRDMLDTKVDHEEKDAADRLGQPTLRSPSLRASAPTIHEPSDSSDPAIGSAAIAFKSDESGESYRDAKTLADDAPTIPSVGGGATGGTGTLGSLSVLGSHSVSSFLQLSEKMRQGTVDVAELLSKDEIVRIERSKARKGSTSSIVGAVLGGHVVIDKIGEGGMGEVYLAKQLSLGRYVALKVLPEAVSSDTRLVDKFIQEANLLARIDHINVVKVFDVQITPEAKLFFTMENVRGASVKALIEEQGEIALPVAINIAKQCCQALARMKREGLTHRDVKPGNILLDEQGVAKVVDFGLADMTQQLAERKVGHTAGTPYYMPPEALRNEPATHLSDQYSLGATFFHMLTGRPPFEASDMPTLVQKHLKDKPPAASSINTEIPLGLDAVLQRMLAKNPEDRFKSFRAVFEALEAVEAKMGIASAQEVFLADKLIDLASVNVRRLRRNVFGWAGFAVASTYAVVGLNALAWVHLRPADATLLMSWMGNWGMYLVSISYLIILYIGSVRKNLLPAYGSIRTWLQLHMLTAFVGSMMLIYHSGNILRDVMPLSDFDRSLAKPVALLPLVNTVVLIFIVISGLIGRYIYTDVRRQLQLDRLTAGARDEDEEAVSPHRATMLAISHKVLGYWRALHYPLTIVFFMLAFIHVLTIIYYGGSFGATNPESTLLEALTHH